MATNLSQNELQDLLCKIYERMTKLKAAEEMATFRSVDDDAGCAQKLWSSTAQPR